MSLHHVWPCSRLKAWSARPCPSRLIRAYSTKVKPTHSIKVACGSNGHIQLDIHPCPSSTRSSAVLYLPPGPYSNLTATSPAPKLAEELERTVVQINYRLSSTHMYPTPIHDVLFGFDWVTQHIRAGTGEQYGLQHHAAPRLGVMGELIGGSLATMLALTECHSKGTRISAAAIHNPIMDWLHPEMLIQSKLKAKPARRRKKLKADETTESDDEAVLHMVKVRSTLFKKPEDWFDPFASPLLFFRSPGVLVPKDDPGQQLDEFEELSRLEQQEIVGEKMRSDAREAQARADGSDISSLEGGPDEDSDGPKVLRKAARRYPKTGSGLVLPSMRITTTASGFFSSQAQEFAELMRRSIARSDEDKEHDPELALRRADERATHKIIPVDSRAWEEPGEVGTAALADWFHDHL